MINLFTDVELLIMGSVVGFLLLIVIILSISELLSRKKEKNVLLEEVEDCNPSTNLYNEEKSVKLEENMEAIEEVNVSQVLEISEIEVVNTSPSIVISSIEEPLIEELDSDFNVVKIESEFDSLLGARERAQIELLKVEEELENNRSLEDTITNLEAIEEENAIISYQELLSNTSELDIVTCDDGDEPITISEVFKMFHEEASDGIELKEEIVSTPLSEAYQGCYSGTPYLSPVNGYEGESLTEIQLENTANLEKLEKEIRKTNEFLNILNELKKNLE